MSASSLFIRIVTYGIIIIVFQLQPIPLVVVKSIMKFVALLMEEIEYFLKILGSALH